MDAAAHVAVVNKPQQLMRRVPEGGEKLLNFSAACSPHEPSRIKRCCVASPWQQGWPHTGHMTDVSEAGVNRVTHSKTKICLQPDPEVLMSSGGFIALTGDAELCVDMHCRNPGMCSGNSLPLYATWFLWLLHIYSDRPVETRTGGIRTYLCLTSDVFLTDVGPSLCCFQHC